MTLIIAYVYFYCVLTFYSVYRYIKTGIREEMTYHYVQYLPIYLIFILLLIHAGNLIDANVNAFI